MTNIDILYYRPALFTDYIRSTQTTPGIEDENPIGKLCGNIWDYYYQGIPANAVNWGKPLNDSIYIWKINPSSSAACNSCCCVRAQNSLNYEVKTNRQNEPVKLGLCLYDISGSYYDSGLRTNPRTRLAYDTTQTDTMAFGGWTQAWLFYDINPKKFCLYPQVSVYDYDSDSQTLRTLSNMVTYINSKSEDKRKVVLIRSGLYFGDTAPRTADNVYGSANNTSYNIVPDILSDRLLTDNMDDTVGAYMREFESSYRIDKVYSPFDQAMTSYFFNPDYITQSNRQFDLGYYISTDRLTFTNGRYAIYDASFGRLTAWWAKISTDVQSFDDVVYKWNHVIYTGNSKLKVPNGYDLTQFPTSDRFKAFSELEIIDKKGLSYGEACKRAVLHEIAFWGFWFADTEDKAKNDPLGTETTGNGVYLPEKIDGTTTGRYFTGDEIQSVDYADADSVSIFESGETPSSGGGYGGSLETNLFSGSVGGSTSLFAFSSSEFEYLMKWLNTTYSPETEDEFIEDFKGVNPAEYIVSVKYFPFDLPSTPSVFLPVYVGKKDTGLTRAPIPREIGGNSLYDLGSFRLEPPYFYGDFRAAYTKLLLYIPWCGYTNLDPSMFGQSPDGLYHSIGVKLNVDYTTGSCMGLVYMDSTLIQTVNGTCGIDIPLTAANHGSYQQQIKQAEIALKQAENSRFMSFLGVAGSVIGTAAMGATGNIPGTLAALGGLTASVHSLDNANLKTESVEYQLEHTVPSLDNVSGTSPANNAVLDQTAKLFIFKPTMLAGYDSKIYSHTVGNACNRNGKLSNFSGLTVCASYDLSGIDCTAEEKEMIAQYLKGGVIV